MLLGGEHFQFWIDYDCFDNARFVIIKKNCIEQSLFLKKYVLTEIIYNNLY